MIPMINFAVLHTVNTLVGAAVAALALFCGTASAQEYPVKPIKIIVPWGGGGAVDVTTRIVAARLAERLSQPIIVENKTGANGMIGADSVAKSAPDGYTLLATNTDTSGIDPHVFPKIPYDAATDFVAIAPFVKGPTVLVARSGLPASSLREAVALVKSQPGKFTYGSWGIGSVPHLTFLALSDETGMDMLHVPYKTGPDAFNAVTGGHLDFMLMPIGFAAPLNKSRKIKALGLFEDSRSSMMENLPTLREQGYKVKAQITWGLVAPAKTPQGVIQRLSSEVTGVLKSPDVQAALLAQGTEILLMSPEEYTRFLGEERAYWGAVVRKFNIKVR